MRTTRLQSTRRWWWNQRQSTSNASSKLEETQTLCGDYGVNCPEDEQQVRAWVERQVLSGARQHHSFTGVQGQLVALELHMDDMHGAATLGGRNQLIKDHSREMELKGGDGCELGKPCEHCKRLRIPMTDETRVQPNTEYPVSVADQMRLGVKT